MGGGLLKKKGLTFPSTGKPGLVTSAVERKNGCRRNRLGDSERPSQSKGVGHLATGPGGMKLLFKKVLVFGCKRVQGVTQHPDTCSAFDWASQSYGSN